MDDGTAKVSSGTSYPSDDSILAEHNAKMVLKSITGEMDKVMYSVHEVRKDVFNTFIPERQIITLVISDFKKCYASLFKKPFDTIGEAINSGDCGLAAFCVGYVLRKLFYIPIKLHDNDEHAWLSFCGVEYDSKYDQGVVDTIDAEWMFDKQDSSRESLAIDFEDIFINHISRNDKMAHRMISGFLARYGLSLDNTKLSAILHGDDKKLFAKDCEPEFDITGFAGSRDIIMLLQEDGELVFESIELMYRFKEYKFERAGSAVIRVKHDGKEYRYTHRDKIISRDMVFETEDDYYAFRNSLQTGPESGRLIKLPGIEITIKRKS